MSRLIVGGDLHHVRDRKHRQDRALQRFREAIAANLHRSTHEQGLGKHRLREPEHRRRKAHPWRQPAKPEGELIAFDTEVIQ